MAKLKIVRQDGSVLEGEITPAVEYSFEMYAKKGFHKAFRDEEKQSDVYWLAWEAIGDRSTAFKQSVCEW
jgi:hypothetical protein